VIKPRIWLKGEFKMKKSFLATLTTAILFSFLGMMISVDQAQADLLGPTAVPTPDNDDAAAMSALLGYTVEKIDRYLVDENEYETDLGPNFWSAEIQTDARYAEVSWDFTGTGISVRTVAVKDGKVSGADVPKWVYYTVTEAQWIVGGGLVDTLADGKGDISHITLYGTRTPVPEPVSMLLFGTGLVGVGGYVRRKLKK
jgi:hypothetical protein